MKIGNYEITAKRLIIFLSALAVLFNLYSRGFLPAFPTHYVPKGVFMALFIILIPLINPPKSRGGQVLIGIFTLMALIGSLYPVFYGDKLNSVSDNTSAQYPLTGSKAVTEV